MINTNKKNSTSTSREKGKTILRSKPRPHQSPNPRHSPTLPPREPSGRKSNPPRFDRDCHRPTSPPPATARTRRHHRRRRHRRGDGAGAKPGVRGAPGRHRAGGEPAPALRAAGEGAAGGRGGDPASDLHARALLRPRPRPPPPPLLLPPRGQRVSPHRRLRYGFAGEEKDTHKHDDTRAALAADEKRKGRKESSFLFIIGLVVGGLANISNTETNTRMWFNFHDEFFFLFLLPPIIFQSGFSLSPKPFFANFGAIVTFAILGTFIASVVTGVLVYLGGLTFLMYKLPFVECLMFGALISATDPVTVLSIFQELGTDVNLYALVFGESVLNDAMAISLYRTMSSVRSQAAAGANFFMMVFQFLETFVGSMSAGVGVGFISALLFKYAGLDIDNLQNLECCLFVLFPYFSYMLAEGLGLSGIVSILFTGMVMKHYTYSNLSNNSQRFVSAFFHLLSSLAETFVFIYMGFDIAMEEHSWSHVGFIFFSIIFIIVARAVNVFSCAYLVNMSRPEHRRIPLKHQKALWFSGLRGAMAFALALQSANELPGGHGKTIFTTTTAIVVLTVLLIGGSTGTMLESLDVIGGEDTSIENYDDNNGYIPPTYEEGTSSGGGLRMKLKEFHKSTTSFTAIDKNFLTPFFTSQTDDDDDFGEQPQNQRRGFYDQ